MRHTLSLTVKAAMTVFLVLLLLIPLSMIRGVVEERQAFHQIVVRDIAQSATENQTVIGPILIIPYRETIHVETTETSTGKTHVTSSQVERIQAVLPNHLNMSSTVTTEERYRGIYKALLYSADISVKGDFTVPKGFGVPNQKREIEWKAPYVVVGVRDIRGIKNIPSLTWQTGPVEFQPGVKGAPLNNGLHAMVGTLSPTEAQRYEFAFDLTLQGMEKLGFVPVGKETLVTLAMK